MITLIFGKSGMGKTSLMKTMLHDHRRRLFIFDVNNEYKEFGALVYEDFYELHQRVLEKEFPIRFFFTDSDKFFLYLSELKNFSLCIDELQLFAPPRSCPESLKNLAQRHRHIEMEFFGAAQRISTVQADLRSQAHRIITFLQTDYEDLKIVKKVGFDPVEVASLKKYKYILKSY